VSRFVGLITALVLALTGVSAVAAQDATPAAGGGATFADTMGLPELSMTVTDDAIDGIPAETAAGRYLVTVAIEAEEFGEVAFVLLPEGKTGDPSDFFFPFEGPPEEGEITSTTRSGASRKNPRCASGGGTRSVRTNATSGTRTRERSGNKTNPPSEP